MPSTSDKPGSLPSRSVRVEQLVEASALELRVLAGEDGLERVITYTRVQKPGLVLSGYAEPIQPERLQVLGATEIAYLNGLDPEPRIAGIANFVGTSPACIVVTRDLVPPDAMVHMCNEQDVALLGTPLLSAVFIDSAIQFLELKLARTTSVHGVLMDVLGVGILLIGKSGIGKSEAALELVMRGHRLVADDVVDIRRQHTAVFGSGSDIIKHHMEIRGLGIINIMDLFGIAAIRDHKKVELVIELVEWEQSEKYDRLGVDQYFYTILDVEVPYLRIPVRPGRNMTSIVEVAARNQLLKFRGHDSARAFAERINEAIAKTVPPEYTGDEVE